MRADPSSFTYCSGMNNINNLFVFFRVFGISLYCPILWGLLGYENQNATSMQFLGDIIVRNMFFLVDLLLGSLFG